MEQASLFTRIVWWIYAIPLKIKQLFCRHSVIAGFYADVFLVEKWERCSGVGECYKCHKDFQVAILANEKELENYQ